MKGITLFVIATLLLSSVIVYAHNDPPAPKSLTANRTEESFKIDGHISELTWQNAEIATGFIALEPVADKPATHRTEVKVVYDNVAIYIGAMMYDTAPDSILREVRQRDETGVSDWFGLGLAPYKDGINAFEFVVTSAGTQFDARISANNYDRSWDAVWESAVQIREDGWSVELKIPYSAIRFPDTETQDWDINFYRRVGRSAEKVFWNRIDPTIDGFVNQFGQLSGVSNIESPVRLSATPFVVGYAQNYYDKNASPKSAWGRSFNAGMDVKYGINDAFTLDMTLIPDFGEANSDNQVLNLSPFEVRFNENRQFFQEGVELFNKGNFLYSRRVGGSVFNPMYESDLAEGQEFVENPMNAQLLNATKVSGRNKKGLGIGVFNAIEAKSNAIIRDIETGEETEVETNPFTNYNVLSFDQNLKNNSYITLINTNVWRAGDAYDANVTGTVFELRNKKNSYGVEGKAALSQKYMKDGEVDLGHTFNVEFGKISGNITWNVEYNEESDTYDINDLGFLYNNNERSVSVNADWNRFEPLGPFNSMGVGLYAHYDRLFAPNVFTEAGLNGWWWGQLKNQWNLNMWSYARPFETYDYFEPRTEGRYYTIPKLYNMGININTDRRKKFQVGFNTNFGAHDEEGRHRINLNVYTRYRASNQLSLTAEVGRWRNYNNVGYVNNLDEDIIFGRRDILTWNNTLGIQYTFTPTMGLNFRLRHYWANVRYDSFHTLLEDGRLGNTAYSDNHDTDFDAFNIDLIYRWRFAPGSDIFFIWKNSIFDSSTDESAYFKHISDIMDSPQTNSLSLKVVYFLDYLYLTKKG